VGKLLWYLLIPYPSHFLLLPFPSIPVSSLQFPIHGQQSLYVSWCHREPGILICLLKHLMGFPWWEIGKISHRITLVYNTIPLIFNPCKVIAFWNVGKMSEWIKTIKAETAPLAAKSHSEVYNFNLWCLKNKSCPNIQTFQKYWFLCALSDERENVPHNS
jgi:hypothetical protein